MNSFVLQLQQATGAQRFENIYSFIGEDASGSFGIMAGHARMMTSLTVGLARFRDDDANWHYLALPGGLLYFHNNILTLNCRHYLLDDDYQRISMTLETLLLQEEAQLHEMKISLRRMEEALLKRMWQVGESGGVGI